MSSEVVNVKSDQDVEAQKGFQSAEAHDSSADQQSTPQPEFVSIKAEIEQWEDQDEHDSEGWEGPQDLQLCPSAFVKTELLEPHQFHVTVKQEPTDHEFAESESSAVLELKPEPTYIDDTALQPGTSYISEEDIPNIIANHTVKNECPICQKKLVNKTSLQRHLLIHTRCKVECHLCHRQYSNDDQLSKHVRDAHNVKKAYECPECKKTFRSASNLFQHKRSHMTEKPHVCNVCNRGFAIKSSMVRHQGKSRCKQPVGPLTCDVCNKEFQRECLLKSHLRMHTTETPFQCECCNMNFKYKNTLIRHVQLHSNDRPHSCKVCGKTFTHSSLINAHMRMHTGEKPYKCPVCQKRFSHKHNMRRHTLGHDKVKHLVCEVCHKKFPRQSRLKYHMRVHLADKRPFKCEYCPKSFSHRQNIQRHYKKKHPSIVYDRPETDASIATIIWQRVMKNKLETEKEYIVPDNEIMEGGDNGSQIREE